MPSLKVSERLFLAEDILVLTNDGKVCWPCAQPSRNPLKVPLHTALVSARETYLNKAGYAVPEITVPAGAQFSKDTIAGSCQCRRYSPSVWGPPSLKR